MAENWKGLEDCVMNTTMIDRYRKANTLFKVSLCGPVGHELDGYWIVEQGALRLMSMFCTALFWSETP